MPPLNNTLQTLPAENRLQIHAAAASIAPYPFTYRCVVQNLDLDQLDLFRAFMDCPNNCSRERSSAAQASSAFTVPVG